MENSSFIRTEFEEAVVEFRALTGGGCFAGVLQLVVTALLGMVLIKGWWNWQAQGLKSIPSKGSFGWPIVGETISALRCGDQYPFDMWIAHRLKRFGTMFKTHLFLKPSIIMTAPEEVKFLFDDPHKVLKSGAPRSLHKIFGSNSINVLDGKEHAYMHKLLADSLLMPELRRKVPEMDRLVVHAMSTWAGNTIELLGALQDMLLKIMTLNFFGIPWEDKLADRVVANLLPAVLGITSIPIYFPGTGYYKARNARKELNDLLLPIIRQMRDPNATVGSKYYKLERFPYQSLLEYEMNGEKISDAGVCDVLVGTVLSGIHAPTNTTAIAIKYLTENPSMLQKVQAETMQLRRKKEETGETAFSPSDLKDLKYTTQVYQEVLRIATITPGASRTATCDVNFNGYVIPKGWRVLAVLTAIHMDPDIYADPRKFDPDRFETPPNPKFFLPFGRGPRTCVGRDISKLLVLMTLYHITTKFKWEIVSPDAGTESFPIARMKGKFELAFKPLSESMLVEQP